MNFLKKWFSLETLITPNIIKIWLVLTTASLLLGGLVMIIQGILLVSGQGLNLAGTFTYGASAGITRIIEGVAGMCIGPFVLKVIAEILCVPFLIIHKLNALIEKVR